MINRFSAGFPDCFYQQDTLHRKLRILVGGNVNHLWLLVHLLSQSKDLKLCGMLWLRIGLVVTWIFALAIIYGWSGFIIAITMLIVDFILLKNEDWSGENGTNSAERRLLSNPCANKLYSGMCSSTQVSAGRCDRVSVVSCSETCRIEIRSIDNSWR